MCLWFCLDLLNATGVNAPPPPSDTWMPFPQHCCPCHNKCQPLERHSFSFFEKKINLRAPQKPTPWRERTTAEHCWIGWSRKRRHSIAALRSDHLVCLCLHFCLKQQGERWELYSLLAARESFYAQATSSPMPGVLRREAVKHLRNRRSLVDLSV